MDRGLASKILLCRSANAIHLFLALGSKLTNLTLLYHLTLTGCQLSKRTRWKILKERKARNYHARRQNHEVQVNQQLIKETLRQIHWPWVQKTSLSIMLLVNKIGFQILRNVWKDYEIEWEMFWRNMQLKWILNHFLKHIYDNNPSSPKLSFTFIACWCLSKRVRSFHLSGSRKPWGASTYCQNIPKTPLEVVDHPMGRPESGTTNWTLDFYRCIKPWVGSMQW